VLTPVIRPIKHSEILPAHVHPVKELGQSQVHVWISSIRPIKHAEILPAHIHPVKELGQSQVHVFTSSIPPLRHLIEGHTEKITIIVRQFK
jgi:hypothetical protein